MTAFLNKLRNDKFNTLLHLNDLIGVFNRDVSTNLTRQEELSLATAFVDMPKTGWHKDTVPNVGNKDIRYGGNVLIPDEQRKAHLVQAMLIAPPVPVTAQAAGGIANVPPAKVRVDVQNGSGITGLAKRVAGLLHAQGFVIGAVGNAASGNVATTGIHEHTQIKDAGLRVRLALGDAASHVAVIADAGSVSTSGASDVTIILGQDIAATLASKIAKTTSQ